MPLSAIWHPVRVKSIPLFWIGYRISIRCAPMRTPFHPDHATNRELRSIMRSYRSMRVRNRAFGRFPRQSVRHVQTSYHIDVRNSRKSKVAPPHVTLVAAWLEPDTNVFSMDWFLACVVFGSVGGDGRLVTTCKCEVINFLLVNLALRVLDCISIQLHPIILFTRSPSAHSRPSLHITHWSQMSQIW